jgi:hypothetical protein
LRPAAVKPPRGSFSFAELDRLRAAFRTVDLFAARLRPTRFLATFFVDFFADFLPDDLGADAMRMLSTRLG